MQNIQHTKDREAVLVPIKDWEKMQKELIRLRKRVEKEKLLRELKTSIIAIETDIKNGVEPKGRDARDFISELMNEV